MPTLTSVAAALAVAMVLAGIPLAYWLVRDFLDAVEDEKLRERNRRRIESYYLNRLNRGDDE